MLRKARNFRSATISVGLCVTAAAATGCGYAKRNFGANAGGADDVAEAGGVNSMAGSHTGGASGRSEAGGASGNSAAGVSGRSEAGGASGNSAAGGASGNPGAGGSAAGGASGSSGSLGASGAAGHAGGNGPSEICGDGVVQSPEQCDDQNKTASDGCSGSCKTESGWTCAGTPSVCKPICGDGVVVGSEPCDDGNSVNTDKCTNQCTCGPALTGAHCELSRFVIITPSGVSADSLANDTNANGTVVTGRQADDAFVWSQTGGVKLLGTSPAISSSVGTSINADGTVIAGTLTLSTQTSPQQAFRWTQGTGMVALNSTSTPNEKAAGISGDGTIIVGTSDRFVGRSAPFRWTSTTGITQLTAPGITGGGVLQISTDGSTAVGWGNDNNNTPVPVKWAGAAAGQVFSLPVGYLGAEFLAVSANGSALFGDYDAYAGPSTPFTWTQAGGAQILSQTALGGVWGLYSVSDDGKILLGIGDSVEGAFVWQLPDGQPQLLSDILKAEGVNLNGMTLDPAAISGDGSVIVGGAVPTSGPEVAFLARWR